MRVIQMNVQRTHSAIRFFMLFGILGIFILAGAPSVEAVTYAYDSPLSFRWDDASGPVDHYNVYVSLDGGPFELMDEVGTGTCQVGAQDQRTYVVQVEAEDAQGNVGPMSDPSDQVVVFMNGSQEDTDGDGMTNAWEASFGLNPFDPVDAAGDLDSDGLTNLEEYNAGTDPTDTDTDDDGVPDGEDQYPLDPLNGNAPPVADAGDDQVLDPTVVTLDGSGSHDPNGDLLSYTWTQQEGAEVELSDSHAVSPAFLGTKSGSYLFELVVHDGSLASLPDQVTVTIRNVPPAADAGPDREVVTGTQVVLDGSGSGDPNEDPLSFSWTQQSGAPVSLQGADSQTASFVPELNGAYSFELVTFDGQLFSPPDEVVVIVNAPANSVPTADAGEDQTAKVGDTVTLNGSGSSDPDGDPLSYSWTQIEGPESVALGGATTAQARFEAPEVGLYQFRLVVTDGQASSAPDTTAVTVESAANQAPVAVIEDPVGPVNAGDWVTLDGSGSFDPDQDPLTYSWTQTSGPQVMLENWDQAVAGFYPVAEGTLAFELVVHDGEVASAPAAIQVQVLPGDPPQVAPPPVRYTVVEEGGGCSVGLAGGSQHKADATDIGYVLTLFLPAIGAAMYQKRKLRRRKQKEMIE
jgi:hypothetical protein